MPPRVACSRRPCRTDRPCRGLEESDDAHPRRPGSAPARSPAAAQARAGDPDRALRPPGDRDAEGHGRRRGRRRRQGHLRQPRARRRRRRRASSSSCGCARPARWTRASAPAARSSRRCPARRSTACARSRSFRDGRIVAAGTLRQADGTTRFVAFRLLPTGEIDPSFGAGFGYVLAGPPGSELGAMVMDTNGNVILGGSRARATSRSSSGCWPTAARTRRSAPTGRSTAPRSASPAA